MTLSSAYTPAQRWVARTIWDFWQAKGYDDDGCAVWVADADGEVSLVPSAIGDHGQARGIAQMWPARRADILAHKGIDMATADVADQCAGIFAEITEPWSSYRHVDALLRAAVGMPAKMKVIVAAYERSAQQDRDIARRLAMAAYWRGQFGTKETA